MKKAMLVILHILGYPVLIALALWANWNVLMTQTKNYGVFAFVGIIVVLVMTIIYYICYAAITAKKKKKRKTIFNQTVRLCMVVVITMTGLWAVCDLALPNFLADATSCTIFYEDLVDGWDDRAKVNDQLLNKFIEMSVRAGTLPYAKPEGADEAALAQAEENAIDYYQNLGYNQVASELQNNESIIALGDKGYNTIGGLFALQYQSIDGKGYQSFTHPGIDFATSDRLTIPCLVHLLLDKREISQDSITNYKYTEYTEKEDGKKEVTSVFFAVADKKTNTITLKDVDWTVLDMLGTDTDIALDDVPGMLPPSFSIVGSLMKNDLGPILNPVLANVASVLASEDIVGGDINVVVETGPFVKEGSVKISLRPTTGYYDKENFDKTVKNGSHKGVLGYQEMAWLNSNGLIYALVTLFSTRRLFLVFAAWGCFINILIGLARGMVKEEKEKRRRIDAIQAPEKTRKPTFGVIR